MCSPVIAASVAGGSSAASGLAGVYGAYQEAAILRRQGSLYQSQANVYDVQASAFDKSASFARAMGGYQSALSKVRATQVQRQGELSQADAARARQQTVGAGKTAFAANGVLLEGRAGSAPAMWEQDEAADLAWEQALIKINADNEVFGLLAEGEMAAASGRMQAASYLGQAAAARLNAGGSQIQAGISRTQAQTAIIQGYTGLLTSGLQGAGSVASIML